jgi:hypothetical protein
MRTANRTDCARRLFLVLSALQDKQPAPRSILDLRSPQLDGPTLANMKPRHTAALAFVAGWLLLSPSADGPTVPLTQSTIYARSMRHTTFPSKAVCLTEIDALRHLHSPSNRLAPLPLVSGADFADVIRVAADDPAP